MQQARRSSSTATRELELGPCLACGQVCEVTGSFDLPGTGGPEPYLRTRCLDGHVMVGPAFAIRADG